MVPPHSQGQAINSSDKATSLLLVNLIGIMSNESLERRSYLESQWASYPEAPEGAVLLPEALKLGAGSHLVVGRISNNHNTLRYNESEISLSEALHQEHEIHIDLSPTPPEILVAGDLVCFYLDIRSSSYFRCSPFYLLAPHLENLNQPNYIEPEVLKNWSTFLSKVRSFFVEKEFLEIETPYLVQSPGTDAQIDAFSVFPLGVNKDQLNLYLPSSPEFSLKKAWAMDYPQIFEIKTCFRDETITPQHQLEFKMLEWYESLANNNQIIERLNSLFGYLVKEFNLDRDTRFIVKNWCEIFEEALGFKLKPTTSKEELRNLATSLKVHWSESDTWNDLFNRIQIDKIEEYIQSFEQPLVIRDFPPSQNTFCRMTDEGWADRFELYWQGVELANAFNEINDPKEQMLRMTRDLKEKQLEGKSMVAFDHELLNSLSHGMCPGAGIALGLDRLFLGLFDRSDIKMVRLFPRN